MWSEHQHKTIENINKASLMLQTREESRFYDSTHHKLLIWCLHSCYNILDLLLLTVIICISWMLQKHFLPLHLVLLLARNASQSSIKGSTGKQWNNLIKSRRKNRKKTKKNSFCWFEWEKRFLWTPRQRVIMLADGRSNAINSKTFRLINGRREFHCFRMGS